MVGTYDINKAYMDMLAILPNKDKLDLISRLVKSMKLAITPKAKKEDIFAGFSGDWGEGMSTEEYADMLRSENVSMARTVEDW